MVIFYFLCFSHKNVQIISCTENPENVSVQKKLYQHGTKIQQTKPHHLKDQCGFAIFKSPMTTADFIEKIPPPKIPKL